MERPIAQSACRLLIELSKEEPWDTQFESETGLVRGLTFINPLLIGSMRRTPTRSVRAISFSGGSPVLSRYTFGSLRVAGVPADVEHFVKRRRSSSLALD